MAVHGPRDGAPAREPPLAETPWHDRDRVPAPHRLQRGAEFQAVAVFGVAAQGQDLQAFPRRHLPSGDEQECFPPSALRDKRVRLGRGPEGPGANCAPRRARLGAKPPEGVVPRRFAEHQAAGGLGPQTQEARPGAKIGQCPVEERGRVEYVVKVDVRVDR